MYENIVSVILKFGYILKAECLCFIDNQDNMCPESQWKIGHYENEEHQVTSLGEHCDMIEREVLMVVFFIFYFFSDRIETIDNPVQHNALALCVSQEVSSQYLFIYGCIWFVLQENTPLPQFQGGEKD